MVVLPDWRPDEEKMSLKTIKNHKVELSPPVNQYFGIVFAFPNEDSF